LRRSGASGYFLPLSGGADSSSVCAIVAIMARLALKEARDGNKDVAHDIRRIVGRTSDADAEWLPETGAELTSYILHTCYMGTENSSDATKSRAALLAAEVGSYHSFINIDMAVAAVCKVFQTAFGKTPSFLSLGGTMSEDLALQNIQARLRMVFSYFLAQLLPWIRERRGYLLVLGSANVDEALRGYDTLL
jgi:NAD+ synthase (glutamine-hydrolysing)